MIVSDLLIAPTTVGANFTEIMQLAPGKSTVMQVLVWMNSALVEMLATLSEAVPLFFTVTVLAGLSVRMVRFPKRKLVGLTEPTAIVVGVALGVAERVAVLVAVGVTVFVAVAVAVLVEVAVGVAVAVTVGVRVADAVGVAVLVAVAVAVPVGVAVGIDVAVAVGVAVLVALGVGEGNPTEPNAITLAE